MNIATLILAAGSSTRMGKPKQLLPYKNTTLLGWTIQNALKLNTHKTFCVLGANATQIRESIENKKIMILENLDHQKGLSSSIVYGVTSIKNEDIDGILIMLADQPKISTPILEKLTTTFIANKNQIVAFNYGNKIGVPAIFPRSSFDILLKLKGDKGAGDILKNIALSIDIEQKYLTDIDTVKQYESLLGTDNEK